MNLAAIKRRLLGGAQPDPATPDNSDLRAALSQASAAGTKQLSDELKRQLIHAHEFDGRLFEDITTEFYRAWCKPGDVIIDAGANHGHHTYQMADVVGPTGTVFSIEAIPGLSDEVRSRALESGRGNVISICAAVANTHGFARFYHRLKVDGWSSLYASHEPAGSTDSDTSTLLVPLTTLDDMLPFITTCQFIKLDLELNEFPALLGGRQLVTKHRPILVFENSRQKAANAAGYTKDEFFRYFDELDYHVYDLFLAPLTVDRWQGDDTVPVYSLALPQERNAALDGFDCVDLYHRNV